MRVHEAFEKKYLARLEKKPQHLHFQSRHPVNFQVTYASDALRQLQDLGLIAKPTIPKSTAFKEQKIAEEGKENAPKLPLTSYLLFQRENRTKLREEFNKQTEFTSFPSYITSVWKALPKVIYQFFLSGEEAHGQLIIFLFIIIRKRRMCILSNAENWLKSSKKCILEYMKQKWRKKVKSEERISL